MKKFALIGAAGYIAPRHMKAIKETGNAIVAAMDKFDSVGILDNYFPNADFFTEFERFDRHIHKLKINNTPIDFVSICSPNYLHDAHIRFGLRSNADVICEKPIVLNPWNIDALHDLEQEYGHRVYAILQLRLHPVIVKLKEKMENLDKSLIHDIDLTYITSRGNWYFSSWKGDLQKSGGIATNIGIHFFDMLSWIFGNVKKNITHVHSDDTAAGYLEFQRARVRWFLSINSEMLPLDLKEKGKISYRVIKINNEELEFSDGFTDLHTLTYSEILSGNGYRLADTKTAVEIVHDIRTMKPLGIKGDYHEFLNRSYSSHPFFKK